jgi:transcriptional regulator with XRE-family HTH domain
MNIAENIKRIREDNGFMQKQVYNEIGLKAAHYNKLEKGLIEPSVDILDKLAHFYGVTMDDIARYRNSTPKEVTLEDKTSAEQLRLIAELEEKDKTIVFGMIETMLTKKKFKDFFQQNIATL